MKDFLKWLDSSAITKSLKHAVIAGVSAAILDLGRGLNKNTITGVLVATLIAIVYHWMNPETPNLPE